MKSSAIAECGRLLPVEGGALVVEVAAIDSGMWLVVEVVAIDWEGGVHVEVAAIDSEGPGGACIEE